MAKKVYVDFDMLLNQIKNFVLDLVSSDPGSPTNGQMWYNTTSHAFKRRRNGATEVMPGNLQVTAPITNSGDQTNPNIGISAATSGAAGSMSAADKAKLDAATNTSTASAIVQRDSNGDFSAHDITANKVTGLATPVGASDAANKSYVDNAVAGIKWKESVRVATTAAGTLATGFENGDTIDGVTLATGDRILIKNQASGGENGIYIVQASGAPVRASDADTAAEVLQMAVWVQEGTTNADSGWVNTTNAPITLGTTALTFAQFNGGAAYTAGNGLTLTGNTFDVGTASSGRIVVNANDIDLASGIVTPGTYRSVTVDTYGRVTAGTSPAFGVKVSANLGDGSSTSIGVTHNLGTRDVIVQVYRSATPYDDVVCDIEHTDTNNVTLKFAVAPASNEYRVVVIG